MCELDSINSPYTKYRSLITTLEINPEYTLCYQHFLIKCIYMYVETLKMLLGILCSL